MADGSGRVFVIVGIDHVQVAAPSGCEAVARGFYATLLGLEEIEKPARLSARGGSWFRAGLHELHVGVVEPFVAAARAHPALRVDSVAALEALAARLVRNGVDVRWVDDSEIPGTRRCHVVDTVRQPPRTPRLMVAVASSAHGPAA